MSGSLKQRLDQAWKEEKGIQLSFHDVQQLCNFLWDLEGNINHYQEILSGLDETPMELPYYEEFNCE